MAFKRKRGSSNAGRPRKDGPRFPGGRLKPGVEANDRVVELRRQLLGDAAGDITRASSSIDLALARGWLSKRQHRTAETLGWLYRRAGLPAAGIGAAASYEREDGPPADFRSFAELGDRQVAEIWDAVFAPGPRPADREAAAAKAMSLYRALMDGLASEVQAELYWVCVAQSWPQWVVWRAAGKPIPAGWDQGRRRLEAGLDLVTARWREIRARAVQASPADMSDVPPQWSSTSPGVRLAK